MDRPVVQDSGHKAWVMVEVIPVRDFKVIRADMAIRAIRAVIIIRGVSSSNNRVIRVIRSS